jgi:hypothetical protein
VSQVTITILDPGPGKLLEVMKDDLQRSIRAFESAVFRAAEKSIVHLQRKTNLIGKNDRGQFRSSWFVEKRANGGWNVVNDAPHAGIIEEGARPHGVNQEGWNAIYEWARRHFRFTTAVTKAPRRGASGPIQRRRSKPQTVRGDIGDDPFLSAVTWGIVKKLKKEGQEPTFMVASTIPTMKKIVKEEVERSIRQHQQAMKRRVPR